MDNFKKWWKKVREKCASNFVKKKGEKVVQFEPTACPMCCKGIFSQAPDGEKSVIYSVFAVFHTFHTPYCYYCYFI